MTSPEDKSSKFALKFITILLLKSPERTVLGVLLGAVFSFFAQIFAPLFDQFQYINLNNAPSWGWIPLGIVFINTPVIISHMIKKPKVNEKIDEITNIIEQGNFSEIERRIMFRKLVIECVKNANLNKGFDDEFRKIQTDLVKEEH